MRMRTALFVCLASFGALVAGAALSLAQPGVPEGTFVRSGDGTIYAVSSGAKIRIAAAPDPGILDELNAAMA